MSRERLIRIAATVAASLAILFGAAAMVLVIFLTEPEAEREGAVKRTAMLVDLDPVEAGTFRPIFEAMGEVRADGDVVLEPQVVGRVVDCHPAFVPGGYVSQGEVLLRIDPADYRNAVIERRSDSADARSALAQEEGMQQVARAELTSMADALSPEQEALVLRTAQLRAAQARVAAGEAAVAQAELQLSRTAIRAPFDAHVVERNATVGAQVSPGEPLARLVGVDTYWIEATMPVGALRHLALPGDGDPAPVEVRDPVAWGSNAIRVGRVEQIVRSVDQRTRLARVLIAVDDPLAREAETTGPPMLHGGWVQVRIQGAPIEGVRITRRLLRRGDTVWVMDTEGALRIREVEVIVQDADYAYISSGLASDAKVVRTDLSTVTEGAPLRTAEPPG